MKTAEEWVALFTKPKYDKDLITALKKVLDYVLREHDNEIKALIDGDWRKIANKLNELEKELGDEPHPTFLKLLGKLEALTELKGKL